MQNSTAITITNWPASDWVGILTAIGTCAAVVVALALALGPFICGLILRPRLKLLLQPNEIPDIDPKDSRSEKELWFHLIVKNTGGLAVKDCRASIIGFMTKISIR